jgi:hypothetical protein
MERAIRVFQTQQVDRVEVRREVLRLAAAADMEGREKARRVLGERNTDQRHTHLFPEVQAAEGGIFTADVHQEEMEAAQSI